MNKEINDLKNELKKEDLEDNDNIYGLGLKNVIKQIYRKETGKNNYFIENNNEDTIEFEDGYLKWLKEYVEKQNNKLKKIKCPNPNCGNLIIYKHKHRPIVCPFCEDEFFMKPKDEYTLFHLQKNYLINRDNKTLGKMYEILKLYAKKLIVKIVKNRYYFRKDELEMKAHDSANKIIDYYLTKPEFKIENSFGGYLNWPIKHVLYSSKQEESCDSLNCMIDNDNELEEYLPTISEETRSKMIVHFEENLIDNNSSILLELNKIIDKMMITINKNFSKKHAILFLIGLNHKFSGQANNFMDDFYLYSGLDVQSSIDKALFFIYKYLKSNY
jgi:ribosomal protein S27E